MEDAVAARFVWMLSGHVDRVTAIRFSPNQKTIATACWDSTARLWDAATGKQLAVLAGHKQGVLD